MVQCSFALLKFAATSWYKPLAMCAEVPSSGYGQGTGAQEGSVPGEGTRMMWVWRPSPGGLLGSADHRGDSKQHWQHISQEQQQVMVVVVAAAGRAGGAAAGEGGSSRRRREAVAAAGREGRSSSKQAGWGQKQKAGGGSSRQNQPGKPAADRKGSSSKRRWAPAGAGSRQRQRWQQRGPKRNRTESYVQNSQNDVCVQTFTRGIAAGICRSQCSESKQQ